jgi:hypothetical protein
MNTNTGQIYEGFDIQPAIDRGEPVVPVSARVAKLMRAAQRAERQSTQKRKARLKDRVAAASRKRNR